MKPLKIILILLCAAAGARGAIFRKPPKPTHFFGGVELGGGWTKAAGPRIAAGAGGASMRGDFGYLPSAKFVFPYASVGASWGREQAPDWEAAGYAETPGYVGLAAFQALAGGYYRQPTGLSRLTVYGGPAVNYCWSRWEALTWDGFRLDARHGDGLGWAALAGAEFQLEANAPHAAGLQLLYGQVDSGWSDLPPSAAGDFTLKQFYAAFSLRYYF